MTRRGEPFTVGQRLFAGYIETLSTNLGYRAKVDIIGRERGYFEFPRRHPYGEVLEPDLSGAYPAVSLNLGDTVTLQRRGGKLAVIIAGADFGSLESEIELIDEVTIRRRFTSHDYSQWVNEWNIPDGNFSLVFSDPSEPPEFGDDEIDPRFGVVYETYTTPLGGGTVRFVVSGPNFSVHLACGRVARVTPGEVHNVPTYFDQSSSFPYYSELPVYTLLIGGQTIPFKWAFEGLPYKTPEVGLPASTKISESPFYDVLPSGIVVNRSSTGAERRVYYSGSAVSRLSPANGQSTSSFASHTAGRGSAICRADGGIQMSPVGREFDRVVQNLEVAVTDGGDDFTGLPRILPSFSPAGIAVLRATIDGRVKSVGIESEGGGFEAPPSVVFRGGGGSGATGVATIEGRVVQVNVTGGGSGYTIAPRVQFTGLGVHASATAAVNSQGQVSGISVSDGGIYRTAPTVTIVPEKVVSSVSLSGGGEGYSSPPAVVIAPDRGASAKCEIDGSVVEVFIDVPGSGYQTPPSVQFSPPVGVVGGEAATGIATVNPVSGQVIGIQISGGGRFYQSSPRVTLSGGGGSGAVASCRIEGPVERIALTSPGKGFTQPPSVFFQGGGGSGAAASTQISDSGSGATATAKISCGVVSVQVTNEGSGYQSSPDVFLVGNADSAESLRALDDGEISRREYNSLPDVVVAQCRIEGFVSGLSVSNGGNFYSRYRRRLTSYEEELGEAGQIVEEGIESGALFRNGEVNFDSNNQVAFSPRIYAYDGIASQPAGGFFFTDRFEQELPSDCVTAPANYPGGALSLASPIGNRSQLYLRAPTVVPSNGHFFVVDAVESARNVASGLRRTINITGIRTGSVESGFYSTASTGYRLGNISGMQINEPAILGTATSAFASPSPALPLLFSGRTKLGDLRFESATFSAQDTNGSGATFQASVSNEQIAGLAFSGQGSNYSDNMTLQLASDPLPGGGCVAQCVVLPGGAVSHITVTAPGRGFLNPAVLVHGGGGSGCVARAIKQKQDSASGILIIEVVAPGAGYSQNSPPQVHVYDDTDMRDISREINNELRRNYPIVRRSGTARNVFATFTSATAVGPIIQSPWLYSQSQTGLQFLDRALVTPAGTYREDGDPESLPSRNIVDTFSRFDRIRSIKYFSGRNGVTNSMYASAPALSFSLSSQSRPAEASCTLAAADPETVFVMHRGPVPNTRVFFASRNS